MIELTREISSLEGTSSRQGFCKLDSQTARKSAHRILSSTLIADNGKKRKEICQRLSQLQGHSATGRIMSKKNSNDTIWNRTREPPVCSAVPQPTAPRRAPNVRLVMTYNYEISRSYFQQKNVSHLTDMIGQPSDWCQEWQKAVTFLVRSSYGCTRPQVYLITAIVDRSSLGRFRIMSVTRF